MDFTRDEYVFLQYVLQAAGINYSTSELLRAAQQSCAEYDIPNAEQIVETLLRERECDCLHTLPYQDIKDVAVHCILLFGDDCATIKNMYAFYMLEKRLPNTVEFFEFLRLAAAAEYNPESYCADHREITPTQNLDEMTEETLAEDEHCAVCQDPILCKTQRAFRLPSCGHVFHASEADCLGDGLSILTWLKQHRTCPNCKQEVVIPYRKRKVAGSTATTAQQPRRSRRERRRRSPQGATVQNSSSW